jgi:hypothetical protein
VRFEHDKGGPYPLEVKLSEGKHKWCACGKTSEGSLLRRLTCGGYARIADLRACACTIRVGTTSAEVHERHERFHDEGNYVNTTMKRTRPVWMLVLLACVLLLAALAGGCKSATKEQTPAANPDKKAMLESVAKWYTAQGALDLAGFKAGIYDPDNILGVATMTAAPKGAKKAEVKWSWSGDNIVLTIPSEQSTITLTASPNQANVVLLKDAAGQGGTFIMKKEGTVWKIDVSETQKATQAQSAAPQSGSGTGAPTTTTP